MGKLSVMDRMRHSLTQPQYPNVGIEFNSNTIRLAVVSAERDRVVVQHLDAEPISPGTIEINPFKPNLHKLDEITDALRALWGRNRFKSSRVCLLLQDRVALTFHVELEHAATNASECIDLIRFKLRKSIPFRIEDAQISFFAPSGTPTYQGKTLWATLMNHAILQQYEQIIASCIDAGCALVDLNTYNLMNLAHQQIKTSSQEQDLLYVNLNTDYISLAITQKDALTFYRSRPLEHSNGILEEALAEIHPTLMFYQDKLSGKGLSHSFVYSCHSPDQLVAQMQGSLGLNAALLPVGEVSGRPALSAVNVAMFAPLIGLIASRKVEFL